MPENVKLTLHPNEVPTAGWPPGPYRVTVQLLNDAENKRLTELAQIDVSVGSLKGSVAPELVVLHAVHLAVGELDSQRLKPGDKAPAGTTYLEIVKAYDPNKGTSQTLAFDDQGQSVDSEKLITQLKERRVAKFGRLSEPLFNRIATMKDTDTIGIYIGPVVQFDLTSYEKPVQELISPPPEEEALRAKIGNSHLQALERNGVQYKKLGKTPFARATTTVDKVKKLAQETNIGRLGFEDPQKVQDLATSIAISRNDTARTTGGLNGSGVRVATYELGPSVITNLSFAAQYDG